MIKVLCGLVARGARLSFVATAPEGGVLVSFRGGRPRWAGSWLVRLLVRAGLVRRNEKAIEPAGLGTVDRMRLARGGKPRAEFEPFSFLRFQTRALREAVDFASLSRAVVNGRDSRA